MGAIVFYINYLNPQFYNSKKPLLLGAGEVGISAETVWSTS